MISKNIIRFILLVGFQVLILNHLNLGGYIYPAIYVYFILLLPFETAGWLLLTASFALGLSVDFFSNTLGLNAAASVFMAFCRPGALKLLKSKRGYEPGIQPGIRDLGFSWFFFYSLILVTLHHSALFFLEVFSISEIRQTLYRIGISIAATMALILLMQFLFTKQHKS
ncbi:MAG: hypothetical protein B6D64_03775 [Bacteroidetes bacterium 4484_276]|nr:MAG: hypothetical protein B6D64_03775 [Bacteroidetes bacterium 4484_276]